MGGKSERTILVLYASSFIDLSGTRGQKVIVDHKTET